MKEAPLNLSTTAKRKINIINETLVTMNKKRKLEEILDRTIQQKIEELEYWQKEREKLTQNRQLKKKLEQKLTQKIAKENRDSSLVDVDEKQVNTVNLTKSCSCEELSQKKRKKKNNTTTGRHMNCFHFSKSHWKTKPLWTGKFLFQWNGPYVT